MIVLAWKMAALALKKYNMLKLKKIYMTSMNNQ